MKTPNETDLKHIASDDADHPNMEMDNLAATETDFNIPEDGLNPLAIKQEADEEITEKDFMIADPMDTSDDPNKIYISPNIIEKLSDNDLTESDQLKTMMAKVYEINDSIFMETENPSEHDDDSLLQYELYKVEKEEGLWSDDENITTELEISTQVIQNGMIINSNVFLTDAHWHTISTTNDCLYGCAVCEIYCDKVHVEDHIKTESHKRNLERCKPLKQFDLSIVRKIKNTLHCGVCNDTVHCTEFRNHESTKTHEGNLLSAINKVSDVMYDLNLQTNKFNVEKDFFGEIKTSENQSEQNRTDHIYFDRNASIRNGADQRNITPDVPKNNNNAYHFNANTLNDINVYDEYSDGEYEEYVTPCEGVSYASMASKPRIEMPKYLKIDLGTKEVRVKFESWHMLITPVKNKFYCMVCEMSDLIRNKSSHVLSEEHLRRLAACTVLACYDSYLVRMVNDKFYHCGHCNNLQYHHQMTYHIESVHPKTARIINTVTNTPEHINKPYANLTYEKTLESPFRAIEHLLFNVFDDITISPFGSNLKISALAYNIIIEKDGGFYCAACDKACADVNAHVSEIGHVDILNLTPFIRPFKSHLTRAVRGTLHCALCNELVPVAMIFSHNVDQFHTNALAMALGMKKAQNTGNTTSLAAADTSTGNPTKTTPSVENLTKKPFNIEDTPTNLKKSNENLTNALKNALKITQSANQSQNLVISDNNKENNTEKDPLTPKESESPRMSQNGLNIAKPGLGQNKQEMVQTGVNMAQNCAPASLIQGQNLHPGPHFHPIQPGQHPFQPGQNPRQLGPNQIPTQNFTIGQSQSQPRQSQFQHGQNQFQHGQNQFQPGQNQYQPGQNFQPGQYQFSPGQTFQPGQNYPTLGQNQVRPVQNYQNQFQRPPFSFDPSQFPELNPLPQGPSLMYPFNSPLYPFPGQNMGNINTQAFQNIPRPPRPKTESKDLNLGNNNEKSPNTEKEIKEEGNVTVNITKENIIKENINKENIIKENINNEIIVKENINKENINSVKNITPVKIKKAVGSLKDNMFSINMDDCQSEEEIEGFDEQEMVLLTLKTSYFKVNNLSYNTLVFVDNGIRHCFVCSMTVKLEKFQHHIDSRDHMKNMKKTKFLDKYTGQLFRQMYLMYHCAICNVLMTSKEIKMHLDWQEHTECYQKSYNIVSKKNRKELKSGMKVYAVETQKEAIFHNVNEPEIKLMYSYQITPELKIINESKPVRKTTKSPAKKKNKLIIYKDSVIKIAFDNWHSITTSKIATKCILCQTFMKPEQILSHINLEYHNLTLENLFETQYYPALVRKVDENSVNCIFCNLEIPNNENMILIHIKGRKHIKSHEDILKESANPESYTDCYEDVLNL